MIVNKITKSIEDRSDCDCNWLDDNDNWIYVKTGSALAEKIMKSAPFMELIFDEMGNLVDISELERPAADESTELTNDDLALAVAELAETAASDKLEIEMAIAELAEVMTNG